MYQGVRFVLLSIGWPTTIISCVVRGGKTVRHPLTGPVRIVDRVSVDFSVFSAQKNFAYCLSVRVQGPLCSILSGQARNSDRKRSRSDNLRHETADNTCTRCQRAAASHRTDTLKNGGRKTCGVVFCVRALQLTAMPSMRLLDDAIADEWRRSAGVWPCGLAHNVCADRGRGANRRSMACRLETKHAQKSGRDLAIARVCDRVLSFFWQRLLVGQNPPSYLLGCRKSGA